MSDKCHQLAELFNIDYSQLMLCIENGSDLYKTIASIVLDLKIEDIDPEIRQWVKRLTYNTMYSCKIENTN